MHTEIVFLVILVSRLPTRARCECIAAYSDHRGTLDKIDVKLDTNRIVSKDQVLKDCLAFDGFLCSSTEVAKNTRYVNYWEKRDIGSNLYCYVSQESCLGQFPWDKIAVMLPRSSHVESYEFRAYADFSSEEMIEVCFHYDKKNLENKLKKALPKAASCQQEGHGINEENVESLLSLYRKDENAWLKSQSLSILIAIEEHARLRSKQKECDNKQENLRSELVQQMRSANESWELVVKEHETKANELNRSNIELKESAFNLSGQIRKLKQEKGNCTKLNKDLTSKNWDIKNQSVSLKEKVTNLTTLIKTEEAKTENLTAKNYDLEAQISVLKALNRSLSEENAKLNNTVKILGASLEVVKSDMNMTNLTLNFEILNLTEKIDNLTSHNDDLRSNVSKLNTQVRELEDRAKNQSLEIVDLKYQSSNTAAKISQLNDTVENMTVRISELQESVSNANASNAHLKSNLSSLTTKLDSCRDAQIGFRGKKTRYKVEITDVPAVIRKFQKHGF